MKCSKLHKKKGIILIIEGNIVVLLLKDNLYIYEKSLPAIQRSVLCCHVLNLTNGTHLTNPHSYSGSSKEKLEFISGYSGECSCCDKDMHDTLFNTQETLAADSSCAFIASDLKLQGDGFLYEDNKQETDIHLSNCPKETRSIAVLC